MAMLCSALSRQIWGDVISISKEHNPMIDGPVHNASHSAGLVQETDSLANAVLCLKNVTPSGFLYDSLAEGVDDHL